MPPLAIVGLGEQSGDLGKNVKVHVVAILVDCLLFQQFQHGAAGLILMQAVPELAAHLCCCLEAGEVGGEIHRGDAGEAEIVEAGGVDEFAAALELMQGRDGGGVAAASSCLADLSGLQFDVRQQAVEDGTLAHPRGADEDAAVALAEKLADFLQPLARGGADLEHQQRVAKYLQQVLEIVLMVGEVGLVGYQHRCKPRRTGGDDGPLDESGRRLRLAGADDAQHIEVGAHQVSAAAGIEPRQFARPLQPLQLLPLHHYAVADHMARVALDADHLPVAALGEEHLDGDAIMRDDPAVAGAPGPWPILQYVLCSHGLTADTQRFDR